MLYLVEVPNSIRFLESRFEEIAEKTDMIDVVAGRVEVLMIQELLARTLLTILPRKCRDLGSTEVTQAETHR